MLKNNHVFSTSFPKLNLIETSKFCSIGQKSVNLPDTKTILKKYEKILIEKKKNWNLGIPLMLKQVKEGELNNLG